MTHTYVKLLDGMIRIYETSNCDRHIDFRPDELPALREALQAITPRRQVLDDIPDSTEKA